MSSQNNSPIYFDYKGIVWKLLIDPVSSVLVTEWRDEENREVDFSAIDLVRKKELWRGLERKEKWWIGLDEVQDGLAVVHGYKNFQSPEHQGVWVYDVHTGGLLWGNKEVTFVRLQNTYAEVYDPSGSERIFKRLSGKDGALVEEYSGEEQKGPESNTGIAPWITNSRHYTSENRYFGKISAFVESFAGKVPAGAIDYLEHKGKIIVSFYVQETEKLVNYLLVITEEGEKIYDGKIGEGIKGIGLETFFLYKDLLIFVKNKTEIVILEL